MQFGGQDKLLHKVLWKKKIALIEETQLGVAWPVECRVFNILLVFWLVEEKEAAVGTFRHELVFTRQIPENGTDSCSVNWLWGPLCWGGHLGSV